MSEKHPNAICKAYPSTRVEVNEEERSIVGYITVDTVDREGEVVLSKGLELETFRKAPTVLWCHDYKVAPFAKCLWIKADENFLWAKTQFAETERGNEHLYLYKNGYLTGFSIGFLPDRAGYGAPTEKELSIRPDWRGAKAIIRKAELVEYSLVPVPCNRESIARAFKTKALDLSDFMVKQLEIDVSQVDEKPPEKPAFSGVERVSAKEYRKAIRKAMKNLDPEQIMAELDVQKIVQDRLHVARGGV